MKKLILIDGNSILFRAYYATAYPGATLMQTSKGEYTNALFAFVNMFTKIVTNEDDYVLVAFDTGSPTIRHQYYDEYKAGRKDMPEELAEQIPVIHKYIELLGIKTYSKAGYEADDIIGTLAKEAVTDNLSVEIFSSDRDLLQLVDDNITVNLLKRGMQDVAVYTPKTLFEEFELTHEQIIDLKALMGDPSDNIPGVPGVGAKTATKLLKDYGTIENVYNNIDQLKGKLKENLANNKELAVLSKRLVTILLDAKIDYKVSDLNQVPIVQEDLISFLQKYELHSFVKQMDVETIKHEWDYEVISNEERLKKILTNKLAIHFEFSDSNYHKAKLWGIGLTNGEDNYFVEVDLLKTETFKKYLLSKEIEKFTYNYKAAKVSLLKQNLDINNVTYDMLLAAYLIDSHYGKEEFKYLLANFNYDDIEYDDLIYGKGVKKGLPEDKSIYQKHIVSKARAIYLTKEKLIKEAKDRNQLKLLEDIEIPLSEVLAEMEFTGLLVDHQELTKQTLEMKSRIANLEKQIIEHAGRNFNVASPKQLGEVLFEDLALPFGKKNKTGYSTNIDVLMKLKKEHPIIPLIMNFRELNKLYTTYLTGMEKEIFDDNKVHTIYMQALTTTGRLSSVNPNLQNIPIRTEEGRNIRKMFKAKEDHYLLGADYSQIELRVLADIADVKELKKAFNHNRDIHSETAKLVFDQTEVDSELRRKAKAVNFGIIYGMGAWSLSEDLDTTPKEAQEFIDKYLSVYPEIKQYMIDVVAFGEKHGYVETKLNRRRYIPELHSKVYQQREFGKRTALNAPIQGTAADILKVAMIELYKYLKNNNKMTKIILQVHDELILEVPAEELEEIKIIVPKIMNEAYQLSVELKTDYGIGKTWYEIE